MEVGGGYIIYFEEDVRWKILELRTWWFYILGYAIGNENLIFKDSRGRGRNCLIPSGVSTAEGAWSRGINGGLVISHELGLYLVGHISSNDVLVLIDLNNYFED